MHESNEPERGGDPSIFNPSDWLSSSETIHLVRTAIFSRFANIAIAKRAHAGLLKTHADLLMIGEDRKENTEVPALFWWASGEDALTQNWELGDFETWIEHRIRLRAFGVRFLRSDVQKMLPASFKQEPPPQLSNHNREGSGRRQSELWPGWVAELVALIHNEGIPPGIGSTGSDELIERVANALAERGLDGPARTTVQDTAKAVLIRLRSAGN